MQEELNQFQRNDVRFLTERPINKNVIGTKWIFKNKHDEHDTVTRNKARVVTKRYAQIKGINFEETFVPIMRLESIRILLPIVCYLKFKLYQMDIKNAFLNEIIQEEVYVKQPKGFVDPHLSNYVYRLKKALYGLKQALRAWYKRLTKFLLNHHFDQENVDKILFIKKQNGHIPTAQIYVDDIIFRSTNKEMSYGFAQTMKSEFEISMKGELRFILGL